MKPLITVEEYERLIAEYSRRLYARDRAALVVALLCFGLGFPVLLMLNGRVSREVFLSAGFAWLGALAFVALWIAFRAWNLDKQEGVVVPCPTCSSELGTQREEVIVSGVCPFCGERAVDVNGRDER